jgi:hypothetical protein
MVLILKNTYIAISENLLKFFLFVMTAFIVFSCGGNPPVSNGSTITVSGKVTYDRVPDTEGGLDYTAIFQLPVKRSLVTAVNSKDNTILQNTYTDNSGNYSIVVPSSLSVKIMVYSVTKSPIIQVQYINKKGEITQYALESSAFTTVEGENITKNLNAPSGYDEVARKLSNERAAAPFAILDNCLLASDFFLANRDVDFPKLLVNWSEKNTSSLIGTSHWDGTELYILGDANVDTDEYDQHVIIHEWGHFFESTIGRSESDGGRHTDGDVLDPRVAFSEGWGNALSAMVLFPDSVYKDTSGLNQSTTGILFDIDKNNVEQTNHLDYKIGWFSEGSVQAIIYDIFDPLASDTNENWDLISSNSGVIYDIYKDYIKNTESLTTIFTFLDAYVKINPSETELLTPLLAKHEMSPVVDEYGAGETNDGGIEGSLPVYKPLDLNSQVVLSFTKAKQSNYLANTQYLKISGVSGKASISGFGTSFGTKSMYLFHKGVELTGSSGLGDISINNFTFDVSKTYILVVSSNLSANQITISLNP